MASALGGIRWFDHILDATLKGRNGPVLRELVRRAQPVVNQARRNTSGENGGPNVDTGRLRGSVAWEIGEDAGGAFVAIGTNVYYGAILELYTFPNGRRYRWLVPALDALPR